MSGKKVRKKGMSGTAKWIITMLIFIGAVATVFVCWSNGNFNFQPGSVQANDEVIPETVVPTDTAAPEDEVIKHKVFISSGKGGSAEPNGCVYVDDWDSTSISFTPDEGYKVQSVTVDGEEVRGGANALRAAGVVVEGDGRVQCGDPLGLTVIIK